MRGDVRDSATFPPALVLNWQDFVSVAIADGPLLVVLGALSFWSMKLLLG